MPKAIETDDPKKLARREYVRVWRVEWRKKNKARALEYEREYYKRTREKRIQAVKTHYLKNRDRIRGKMWARQIVEKYGITPAEFESMAQNGCQICGLKKHSHNRRLHIDHCHDTGKVRGVLCNGCNTGIGGFRDDPEIMRKAIAYLAVHGIG